MFLSTEPPDLFAVQPKPRAEFSPTMAWRAGQPERAVQEMVRVSRKYVVVSEPNNKNPILFIGSLLIPAERKAALFSRAHVTELLSRELVILQHTHQGGLLLPSRTPEFMFGHSRPESFSAFSFFQIFICQKMA